MSNLVSRVLANVRYKPKTGVCDSFSTCDVVGQFEERAEHLRVVAPECRRVLDVTAGNNEDVRRCHRGDISKGDRVIIFRDNVTGDFACQNLAEEAIRNGLGAHVIRATTAGRSRFALARDVILALSTKPAGSILFTRITLPNRVAS